MTSNRFGRILIMVLSLIFAAGLCACESEKKTTTPTAAKAADATKKEDPTTKGDATKKEDPTTKGDATKKEDPTTKGDPTKKEDPTTKGDSADAPATPKVPADAAEAKPAETADYLRFSVGHIGKPEDVAIGNMAFTLISAKVNFADLTDATNMASFEVDLGTIDTANGGRDKHLKSPDFFDIEKFAKASFTIKGVGKGDAEESYTATATLDLHGVKQEVPVSFKVVAKTDTSVTIEGASSLKRTDFKVGGPEGEKGPLDAVNIELRTTLENK